MRSKLWLCQSCIEMRRLVERARYKTAWLSQARRRHRARKRRVTPAKGGVSGSAQSSAGSWLLSVTLMLTLRWKAIIWRTGCGWRQLAVCGGQGLFLFLFFSPRREEPELEFKNLPFFPSQLVGWNYSGNTLRTRDDVCLSRFSLSACC